MTDSNLCKYSSYLFLSNSLNAWLQGYPVYASAFLGLTTSSVIYHSYPHSSMRFYFYVVDQWFILSVFACGGEMFYQKIYDVKTIYQIVCAKCILWTFLITVYMYFYGYTTRRYCHDPDIELAYLYHAILHVICSVGHHLVLLM
jgi:hypothetical protein